MIWRFRWWFRKNGLADLSNGYSAKGYQAADRVRLDNSFAVAGVHGENRADYLDQQKGPRTEDQLPGIISLVASHGKTIWPPERVGLISLKSSLGLTGKE